jgi:hypothetical protein
MGNVLAAARELLHQQHYDEVVQACQTALDVVPDHVGLRLLLAESLMSMRRDAEAQQEVAAALKVSPACPDAFRLLGALAFRRDELRAAEIFLREALRVAPDDRSSSVLLEKVRIRKTPAAAAAKLPAASAAAGPSLARVEPPRRRALGTEPQATLGRATSRVERNLPAVAVPPSPAAAALSPAVATPSNVPVRVSAAGSVRIRAPRIAGLDPTPTGSFDLDMSFGEVTATDDHPLTTVDEVHPDDGLTNELPRLDRGLLAQATPRKQPWVRPETYHGEKTRGKGVRLPTSAHDSVAVRLGPGNVGFGEYLVITGVLTRWQLYRVLQVQDWKHMRVGEAAVELGYVSARRVEQLLQSYEALLAPATGDQEADTVA